MSSLFSKQRIVYLCNALTEEISIRLLQSAMGADSQMDNPEMPDISTRLLLQYSTLHAIMAKASGFSVAAGFQVLVPARCQLHVNCPFNCFWIALCDFHYQIKYQFNLTNPTRESLTVISGSTCGMRA